MTPIGGHGTPFEGEGADAQEAHIVVAGYGRVCGLRSDRPGEGGAGTEGG